MENSNIERKIEISKNIEKIDNSKSSISITDILAERGSRYGSFIGHARITQRLKQVLREELELRGKVLPPEQAECLDMIFHKVGRIVNGDHTYSDNYIDISGYAKLIVDILEIPSNK